MSGLKRDPVKYIRDRVKSNYTKDSECRICGSTQNLEFHHFHSVAEMYNAWASNNSISVDTVEDIISVRDRFIEEHWSEMVEGCVTLCKLHHLKLHKVYGKNPKLPTAPKQARWVERQRLKTKGPGSS